MTTAASAPTAAATRQDADDSKDAAAGPPRKRQATLTALWPESAVVSVPRALRRPEVDVGHVKGFQYITQFLPDDVCARYYHELETLIDWEYKQVVLAGKTCQMNRLTCAFSLDGSQFYRYSGTHQPTRSFSVSPAVAALVEAIETMFVTDQPGAPRINYVLLNYYKNGTHSLGLHSDAEHDLVGPVYGISLNEAGSDNNQRRLFDIVNIATGAKTRLPLDNGSLMIMRSTFQKLYKHGVPAQKHITTGRINLTMRSVRS